MGMQKLYKQNNEKKIEPSIFVLLKIAFFPLKDFSFVLLLKKMQNLN